MPTQRFFDWLKNTLKPTPRKSALHIQAKSPANLRTDRLEDRRVLNGVPAGFTGSVTDNAGAVVITAGTADGIADTFSVQAIATDHGDQVQFRFGNELIHETRLDQFRTLNVEGSADRETLSIDLSEGLSDQTHSFAFFGQTGGVDSLSIDGIANSAAVQLTAGGGQASFQSAAQSITFQFGQSIGLVQDTVHVQNRTIAFAHGSGISDLDLGTATTNSRLTTVSGFSYEFAASSGRLEIQSQSSGSGLQLTSQSSGSGSGGGVGVAGSGGTGTAAAELRIESPNGITISSSINTPGALYIDADTDNDGVGTLTLGSSVDLRSTTDGLTLYAAQFALPNRPIDAGTGFLRFSSTGGRTMGIGSATGDVQVSGSRLNQLFGQSLILGSTRNGDVAIRGVAVSHVDQFADGVSVEALRQGGRISLTGSNELTAFSAFADAGIDIVGNQTANSGRFLLNGDADNSSDGPGLDQITIAAGITLRSRTSDIILKSTTGGIRAAGNLILNAADGILIDSAMTVGGTLTADADTDSDGDGTFRISATGSVTTAGTNITITSADIDLNGAMSTGVAGRVSLQTKSTRTIGIGNGAGDWRLTNAEIALLATPELIVGGSGNGLVTVDGVAPVNAAIGSWTIQSLQGTPIGVVLFNGGVSQFTQLVAQGNGGVTFETDVRTTQGDLKIIGGINGATDGIQLLGTRHLTAAGRLELQTTIAAISATGELTLDGGDGVTLRSRLVTQHGVAIDADTNRDGVGTFTLSAGQGTSTTGNSDVRITAADMDVISKLNAGTGTVTLLSHSGRTVALGSNNADWELSGSEVIQFTAQRFIVGNASNGNVSVGGLNAQQTEKLNQIELNATGVGRQVLFTGSQSIFAALLANSDNGIRADRNVTTLVGNLVLNGDFDNKSDGDDRLVLATGVKLTSAGQLEIFVTSGQILGEGTAQFIANNGIRVHENISTLGALRIDADNDDDGVGTLQFDSGNTISSAGGGTTLLAAQFTLPGSGSISAGTGDLRFSSTGGRTMGVGSGAGDVVISNGLLNRLQGARLLLGGTQNGNITVAGVSAASTDQFLGGVVLEALRQGGQVHFSGSASEFSGLDVQADAGIDISSNVTTNTGDLFLNADHDNTADGVGQDAITISASRTLRARTGAITLTATTGGLQAAGPLTLLAADGVQINAVSTVGGLLTIDADSDLDGNGLFGIGPNGSITSFGTDISVTSADVNIQGGLATGVAGKITLQTPLSRTMGVGNALGDWSIDLAEIAQIQTAHLIIGGSGNGLVTVDGVTPVHNSIANWTIQALQGTPTGIVLFTGGSSTFTALTVQGNGGVTFETDVITTQGGLKVIGGVNGATDGIQLRGSRHISAAGHLELQTSFAAISSTGNLILEGGDGVTLRSRLMAQGQTTIDADTDRDGAGTFTLSAGQGTTSTANNDIQITAADMDVVSKLNAGTGTVTLLSHSGRTMSLGGTTGDWALSGSEVIQFTARQFIVGDNNNGNLLVGGLNAVQTEKLSLVELNATGNGRNVAFIGGQSTFATLIVNADNGIRADRNVTTLVGDLILNADFDNNSDGDDRLVLADGVKLTSAGIIEVFATSGQIRGEGAAQFIANNGIRVHENVSTVGALRIDADQDDNGIGALEFDSGNTITSDAGGLTLLAAQFILPGSGAISAGAGDLRISSTGGRTMGIGSATGDVALTSSFLNRLQGSRLILGGTRNGNIDVAGVTPSATDQFLGGVVIEALRQGGQISFTGTASEFSGLDVRADAGINVSTNLTTSTGDLILNADRDNAADGTGQDAIVISAGRTLRARAGAITLNAATGGLQAAGALTLVAADGVQINSVSAIGGLLTIDADNDLDGLGTFGIGSTGSVSTPGSDISVISADVNLQGGLSTGTLGKVTLQTTLSRTIGIGNAVGDWQLDLAEIARIQTGHLIIGGTGNSLITVDGVAPVHNAIANWTLQALQGTPTGVVLFAGGSSEFTALTVQGNGGVTFEADVRTTQGGLKVIGGINGATDGIQIRGDRHISAAGLLEMQTSFAAISTTGNVTLEGGDGVIFRSRLMGQGMTTIDADTDRDGIGTFTLTAGAGVSRTANHDIQITSAEIDFVSALDAGAGTITLLTHSGRTMSFGSNPADWRLSSSDTNLLTASKLIVGDAQSGSMVVGSLSASQTDGLSLVVLNAIGNGRQILFTGGTSNFVSLQVNADNGVRVERNVTTTVGDLQINGDFDNQSDGDDRLVFANNITLFSAGALEINVTNGEIIGEGITRLTANSGITLHQNITTVGALTITADQNDDGLGTLTNDSGNTIHSQAGGLSLLAAQFVLPGNGAINAGSGDLRFSSTGGRSMGVGTGTGDVLVDGALLNRMTGNRLILGGTRNGNLIVGGVQASFTDQFANGVVLEALRQGATIRFIPGDSTFNSLLARSDAGIDVGSNITTTGDLTLNGDNDNTSDGPGLDNLTIASGVILTSSAGSITLDAQTGGMQANGLLTLLAADGVRINPVTTLAGLLTVDADTDLDGAGTFTIGSNGSVTSLGTNIAIRSADIELQGALSTGINGQISLETNLSRTMGLGNAVGDWRLDQAEIARIQTAQLTIGGISNGPVFVSGVSPVNSDIAAWTIQSLQAPPIGRVTFTGDASQFTALTVQGNSGVTFETDVSTTQGDLRVIGGVNAATDGIRFIGDRQLLSAGLLELQADLGAISSTATLSLSGRTGVSLLSKLLAQGMVIIDADSDRDGTGTFRLNAGSEESSTANNSIQITSADIEVLSRLNAGTGTITLLTHNGRTISLGVPLADWHLDGQEIDRLQAQRLFVGDTNNGDIRVGGLAASQTDGLAAVELNATGNGRRVVIQDGDVTFTDLTVNADNGIQINSNVSSTTGDLRFDGDVDLTSDGGDRIVIAGNVVLTSHRAIQLRSSSGGLLGEGNATLLANTGIILQHSFHVLGNLRIEADRDANSVGLFAANGNIVVDGTSAIIIAADIDTLGNLAVANGTLELRSAASQILTVGSATGAWTFDSSEFSRTTTQHLIIGGATATRIEISGITSAASSNVAQTDLLATPDGGQVRVTTDPVTLNRLTIRAADGIDVQSNLTGAGAPLNLFADNDLDCIGDLIVGASATLDSAGQNIVISAADIELNGLMTAGTGNVILNPSCPPLTIGLGTSAADFAISQAEFNRIVNTTGQIQIGTLLNTGGIQIAFDEALSLGTRTLIATTGGSIDIRGIIQSTTGTLALTAGHDILFSPQGSVVSQFGSIDLTAGEVPLGPPGRIVMAESSRVDSGAALVRMRAAGDVLLGLVRSGDDVLIESRTGSIRSVRPFGVENIVASGAALRAATGIGSTAAAIETRVDRLAAANIGTGNVAINNAASAILSITQVQGIIGILNHGGGRIDIATDGLMSVDALVTTTPGVGGTLTVTGAVDVNVGPIVGSGNVTLTAAGDDDCALIINTDQISASSIILTNDCDIIVSALLRTTGPNADIVLIADSDHDGSGGVRITPTGFVDAGRDVIIEGSQLESTIGVVSVRVDVDGDNPQIRAGRDITLRSGPFAPAGATIVVGGNVQSLGGTIAITALESVRIQGAISGPQIQVTAQNGVDVIGAAANLHGATTVNADSNRDGLGTFHIGPGTSLNTGDRGLQIIAAQLSFLGTVSTGTADLIISPSQAQRTIGLGATSADFQVTQSELSRIVNTTGTVQIGDSTNQGGILLAVTQPVNLDSLKIQLATGASVHQGTHNVTGIAPLSLISDADGNGTGSISTAGGRIILSALNAKGATSIQLLTSVERLSAENTHVGNIDISELDDVTLVDVRQLGVGALDVVAGGSIDVTHVSSARLGTNAIHLQSNQGAIRATAGPLPLPHIEGLTATLQARDGIGSGSPITVNLNRLAALNDRSGTIEIQGTGTSALTFGTVSALHGVRNLVGDIALETVGQMGIEFVESTGLVRLKNHSQGIVDSQAGSAVDLRARQLQVQSAGGFGSGDPLEVEIESFAGTNIVNGAIRIANQSSGLLTIETVGGIAGVSNSNGSIEISTLGHLRVQNDVKAVGGIALQSGQKLSLNAAITATGGIGNIALTSGNDLTLNAPISATGGSSSVVLTAGNDLILNNTAEQFDILVQNAGQIVGTANGIIQFDPGTLLRSGTGVVPQLIPSLANVNAPDIMNSVATVSGTFGDPNGQGYIVQVNWGDGTIDQRFFAVMGTFQFQHFYLSNPDSSNSSAPIPIKVTVFDDPNISLSSNGLPPVVTTLPNGDIQTETLGATSVATFAEVPGEGITSSGFVLQVIAAPVTFPATTVATVSLADAVPPPIESRTPPQLAATSADVQLDKREVFLEILDADGNSFDPERRVPLSEDVLDDLSSLFERLPDGRYRVFIREVGEKRLRKLFDIQIRGGRPSDGDEVRPNTESTDGQVDSTDAPGGIPTNDEFIPTGASRSTLPSPAEDYESIVITGDVSSENRATSLPRSSLHSKRTASSVLAGAVGVLAIASQNRPWSEQVRSTLEAPVQPAESIGKRLLRRLRLK